MNQEISIQPQPRKLIRRRLVWFGVYTASVFLLSIPLYMYLFTSMVAVPLVSGLIFPKLVRVGNYWKSLLWQASGLIIGNLLLHYIYVIPFIYKGDEPWSEEIGMRYLVMAVQIIIAAIILLIVRIWPRNKPIT